MKAFHLVVVLFMCSILYGQKSGTITIKKKESSISGVFKDQTKTRNKYVKYLYFKDNGYVYQFTSSKKEKEIKELTTENLAELRPIIATYKFNDNTIKIIPSSAGIKGGIEPGHVHYYGVLKENQLELQQRSNSSIFLYTKLD